MEVKKTKTKGRTKTKTISLLLALTISLFVAIFSVQPSYASTDYIITVDCQSYDGYLYDANAVYSTVRNQTTATVIDTIATLAIGQSYSGGLYKVYRSFVFFDTSSIPDDATIDNATLSFKVSTVPPSGKNFNLTIQNGQPTYPHIPLEIGDYSYQHYSGDGGNISTSEMVAGNYCNLSLSTTGLSWIDLDGNTKLVLRGDADLNATTPTTFDILSLKSTENGAASTPKLYIGYTVAYNYAVNLYGPYNEDGERNYSGINCTFTRPTQAPLNFELNGTYSPTAETDTRLVITSDCGSNLTRVYYLRYDQWYEDIYIFYPDDIATTYYVTLVDYVGLTNPYLESILNINGTYRIIERQRVDVINDIPFILSWGTSYKFRLICDEGTYTWQSVIAGTDTTFSLTVTSVAFPPDSIYIGNITLSATRTDDITITALYDDSAELTEYVYVSFTEYPDGTSASYYTNNTGNTQNITWSDANPNLAYAVYFSIVHEEQGTLTYTIVVTTLIDTDNPWDFSWLGDWGGIDSTQILGVIIVFAVFGAFSYGSVEVGLVAMLLTAGILNLIGWLKIPWEYFTIVFALAILVIIGIKKSHQKE